MFLKCECCKFEKEFLHGDSAFRAGWDAPPFFTGYVTCDLCPASFALFQQTNQHEAAHARWKIEGRPESEKLC